MSLPVIFVTVLVYTLLTLVYVKGIRFVERHSPDNLVRFHFIMVAVRFIFAVTMVGIYVMFSDNRENSMHFAALSVALYLTMIVVTLIFKIKK